METMDHSLYEPSMYDYSAPSYRATHLQYPHQSTQNIQNVSHLSQTASHHRRDSSVSGALDHPQGQAQYGHQPQSPPLRQIPQSPQQQQQSLAHHHHQHAHPHSHSISSRPRANTSAAVIDVAGSSSTPLLHDSRPRAHSYGDPRTIPEQRNKQGATSIDELAFGTNNSPQELDEEPLYVNAKQYHRILKRRAARARQAELQKLSTQRKPYLHQSRHNHAVRRPRGPGGRFLTAEEIAARKGQDPNGQDGEDSFLNESPTSPTQDSLSSPQDDLGSPTGEHSAASLTAAASSAFGYPPAPTGATNNVGTADGSASVLNFGNDTLGAILESTPEIGIEEDYQFNAISGTN
ncbi:Transcriptional activator [Serendipita sp. 405]|nr:Transcriptional activator [Serendipita sp. 405]